MTLRGAFLPRGSTRVSEPGQSEEASKYLTQDSRLVSHPLPPLHVCLVLHVCRRVSAQRLGAGEWFTARVSACGLFHIVYPSASEAVRTELRTLYGQLSHDDMPMVRRSAAQHMGKFAATVEPAMVTQDILGFFKDLTNDGEASSRVLFMQQ